MGKTRNPEREISRITHHPSPITKHVLAFGFV